MNQKVQLHVQVTVDTPRWEKMRKDRPSSTIPLKFSSLEFSPPHMYHQRLLSREDAAQSHPVKKTREQLLDEIQQARLKQ